MHSGVNAAEALPALLATFAWQVGAKLVIDPQAKKVTTTQDTVVFPSISTIAKGTETGQQLYDMAVGCAVHGAARVRYGNRERVEQWRKLYRLNEETALIHSIQSQVEDVYLRSCIATKHAHLRGEVDRMWTQLAQRVQAQDTVPETALQAGTRWLFAVCQSMQSDTESTQALLEKTIDQVQSLLTVEQMNDIHTLAQGIPLLQDVDGVLHVASKVLAYLGVTPKQPEPEQESQKSQQKNQQSQSPPQEEGAPSQPSDQTGGGEGQSGAGPKGEAELQPGEVGGDANTTEAQTGEQDTSQKVDPAEAGDADSEQPSNEVADDGGETGVEVVAEVESVDDSALDAMGMLSVAIAEAQDEDQPIDEMDDETLLAELSKPGNDLAAKPSDRVMSSGQLLLQRVRAVTMMASARLSMTLQAQTQATSHYGRKGKLIAARAWKLAAGNVNIFRKDVDGRSLSTAITTLLDASLSMESGMQTAIEAAVFMPLAVGDLDGIETRVDIFPGRVGYVETLKNWGERTVTTLDRMASVKASGGTPMAEALEESGTDLLCQTTDRKILLVITDGDPFGGPAPSAKIVRRLQQAGVEVVGVGIGRHCKDLVAIFPDNVKIANVGQLTEALAKIFEQRMLDQKCA